MAIDFGAFTQGSSNAKKDYWADVRNSQQSLIRDVAVQDGLSKMREMADQEAASSYLAPLLVDQQRAAANGVQADDWYQRATQSILNDEGFKSLPVEQQQHVMNNMRAQGVTLAQKLVEAGDNDRALALNKSLGLQFGPENRANPSNVFNAADLTNAGFVNDEQAGVWRGPNGQVIPAYQGAQAINLQGQPGLTQLLADQAEVQRRMAEGVTKGTHVEMTDAQGNRTFREKTPIEMQMDTDKLTDAYRQNRIAESVKNGSLDPTNRDSINLYILGTGDAAMGTAIAAYNQRQNAAPAVVPQAVVAPVAPVAVAPVAATPAPAISTAPVINLDPKFLETVNQAPAAVRPVQQALAVDAANNTDEVTEARNWLEELAAQQAGAPLSAEDSQIVESLLRANRILLNDTDLMIRLGIAQQ